MTLKKRYLVLSALILTFIIIAPVVIFGALGYRYDFSARRLVQTGSLVIKSDPDRAEIFINGVKSKYVTPVTIRFLLPDEYDIALKKQGYITWQKRLTVLRERVTYAHPNNQKIALFFKNPIPRDIEAGAYGLLATDKTLVSWTATSTLSVKDLNSQKNHYTSFSPVQKNNLFFSPSNETDWVIARDEQKALAINLSLNRQAKIPSSTKNIKKIQGLNENELVFLAGNGNLYQFDTKDRTMRERRLKVTDFTVSDGRLYFFENSRLFQTDRASTTVSLLADNLPPFTSASVVSPEKENLFALLDKNLYKLGDKPVLIEKDVVNAQWIKNEKILFYHTKNAIWIYEPLTSGNPQLLARFTEPITQAEINISTGCVYYLQENTITVLEIYGMPRRVSITLIKSEKQINNFYIDPEGKNIFYYVPESGVFKSQIR